MAALRALAAAALAINGANYSYYSCASYLSSRSRPAPYHVKRQRPPKRQPKGCAAARARCMPISMGVPHTNRESLRQTPVFQY